MHSDLTIRNYHPADFNVFVQLKNMAAILAADGSYNSPEAVRILLGRPNYEPEQDLFIAEIEGNAIGYLDIDTEVRISRVILEVMVLPEYRQQGIACELYRKAIPCVKSTGAKAVHINVSENNAIGRLVLEKVGFSPVRRFLEMRTDLIDTPEPNTPTGLLIQPFREGEESALTELQNRAYADSWGYNPNTVDDIAYATGTTSDAGRGIYLAFDTDVPIGYFWVKKEYTEQDRYQGRIAMLGVDPNYRRKGIGRVLVLAGLSYLKSMGSLSARLTVDSENLAANALYYSIGFKEIGASLWYEKAVD